MHYPSTNYASRTPWMSPFIYKLYSLSFLMLIPHNLENDMRWKAKYCTSI